MMKINNTGSSMSALSLESDDSTTNPALLFSQFLPLTETPQKMPEVRQENVAALPELPVVSEKINLPAMQPELATYFANNTLDEKLKENLTQHLAKLPSESLNAIPLDENALSKLAEAPIAGALNKVIPQMTSDALASERDEAVDFSSETNDVITRSLDTQKMLPQIQLRPRDKSRVAESDTKLLLEKFKELINGEEHSEPLEMTSLLSQNKMTDAKDTQDLSKDAITFSSLLKSGDDVAMPSTPARPEQVINTMVDFINKKINASPTEATFSQGTKKIALTEIKFVPEDLTSLKVDSYTAKLKVYPPDLGQVIAEIQVHNGQTELTIRTENPQVKHFIEQHLTHLRDSFEQSNINLGQVSIQDNSAKDNSPRQQGFYNATPKNESEIVAKDTPVRNKLTTDQTIDTYA